MSKAREEFEAWWFTAGGVFQPTDRSNEAWHAYCAGRAAGLAEAKEACVRVADAEGARQLGAYGCACCGAAIDALDE